MVNMAETLNTLEKTRFHLMQQIVKTDIDDKKLSKLLNDEIAINKAIKIVKERI